MTDRKTPSPPIGPGLAGGLALAFLASVGLGRAEQPKASPQVSGGGFTLRSAETDLPDDGAVFPEGAGADTVNANCLGCHSASMALTQPRLSEDQWKAIVAKMRGAYKAPIAETDVPAIVLYLRTVNTKLTAAEAGSTRRAPASR